MSHSIIEIKDMVFAYNERPVLENVNLEIDKGDFASVVGPNGGGKTTLLRIILGLLKVNSGSVKIFGMTPEKARIKIGYMPQHTQYDFKFPVSVLDVVMMGRMQGRGTFFYKSKDKEAAIKALTEVELESVASKSFFSLSGGQRQRVLIARALAVEPELLLLDEPTANVDSRVEQKFYDILKRVNKRMTILMVSHDLGFVSSFVQRVICVNKKVIVHPTSDITGEVISEIYGGDLKMVRHDHCCSEGGHNHV
jgi:zinc transport system ATP-binding protein